MTLSQAILRMFTDETSGFAVTNSNDFDGGMNRLVDDFDHYYLIGFYPADPGTGRQPVEVTVNRPGVTVRYRRGYELGGRPTRPKDKDPLVALSTGVLPQTDLALRLFAVAAPTAAKRSRELVALEVRAPREAFAAAAQDDMALTVLAVDLNRAKVTRNLRVARAVDLAPALARSGGTTVAYTILTSLDLSPGTYQLRASAKSARLEKSGSVYLTVEVPAQPAAALLLGGIVLGDADAEPVSPAGPSLLPFEPTLDRTFTAADRLRVFASLAHAGSKPVSAKVELVDGQGRVVHAMDVQNVPLAAPGIDVTLGLAGLSPGPFTLTVTATDGKTSVERTTAIEIRR